MESSGSLYDRTNSAYLYDSLPGWIREEDEKNDKIKYIDKISEGFIYMVSSYNVTGAIKSFNSFQKRYFKRINEMNLNSPLLVGFGISNKNTFIDAGKYSRGAIIGSAYINWISENGIYKTSEFIKNLRD